MLNPQFLGEVHTEVYYDDASQHFLLQTVCTDNGGSYSTRKVVHLRVLQSLLDIIWEDIKVEIKKLVDQVKDKT